MPLPALNVLAPWLQLLPQCGLLLLWQITVISPVWKQKGTPLDPAIYWELTVLHPLRKLLALSYLHCPDADTHCHSWLVEEQAGFYLGNCVEDYQILLTYLLLAASYHQGP